MAQHDYNIANASFPTVRTDINNVLSAVNSSNSGSSRPSSAVAGTIWLDTSGAATAQLLKMYDGAADITLGTINFTANTVDWTDSAITLGANSVDSDNYVDGSIDLEHLAADSVNATKIADNSISEEHLDVTAITGHSAETSIADGDLILIHDASSSSLKKMTKANFVDGIGGGIAWQSSIVTGTTLTAVAGRAYWINTTSNVCTITLPSSASVGDQLIFTDYARKWATNNVTLNRNGLKFQGGTVNPVYDINGQSVDIVYSGATNGWIPNSDDDVTDESVIDYDIDFLVIAGGAGGSRSQGGGGGAGGYRNSFGSETSGGGASSETALTVGLGIQYTVTIGAGGAGSSGGATGTNGANSSISGTGITTITSIGGGGGGGNSSTNGNSGGSGGGNHQTLTSAGGAGTSNQGFAGGAGSGGSSSTVGAGGGGGASEVGETGKSSGGGDGGNGLASAITGSSVTRGGGGGGSGKDSGTVGQGGSGGGGNSNNGSTGTGGAGTANTGGGGGGTHDANPAAAGGSGVVILSMADADYSGTTTGSPTVNTGVSGKTVIIFNSSGSYTS